MKKKNRIKISLHTIATREEAESVMNELACLSNNQRKLAADRDAQVLSINEAYESQLSECAQALLTKTEALRHWAESNPDQFPKGRKSIDFLSGILGFRTGTPKLALLGRAWSWEKVLAALKLSIHRKAWIRTKEEVDKDTILGEHSQATDKGEFEFDLKYYGLRVTQDESFYVEPNLTEVPTRQVSQAA